MPEEEGNKILCDLLVHKRYFPVLSFDAWNVLIVETLGSEMCRVVCEQPYIAEVVCIFCGDSCTCVMGWRT